ncbi:hypothetical protein AX15_005522 [Amanita polypyramis BW_CC]|nr:hypothetical protein AX15_005522 [Amanita polypyramis BW_CC]
MCQMTTLNHPMCCASNGFYSLSLLPEICTSPSASSSDSGDSGSEDAVLDPESKPSDTTKHAAVIDELEDDDEGAPAQPGTYIHTKNEVVSASINVPDIHEVGPDEAIEKVGEIMSIVDNVVIIKALPSEMANRGSDKALDSDTLLVFDDRKVLGYVYETFGPTSQPLYQIRFNDTFPLDPEKVRVSREVFHIPQRSNFVFVREIRKLKGSDASNVHDEEPAEDEVEFSDDEAEAAHRSRMKKKRSASRASSQQPPTIPSQAYEQGPTNVPAYSGTAFDAYGPYDADYGMAPPRPPPMPYDDPYSDEYSGVSSVMTSATEATVEDRTRREAPFANYKNPGSAERGRGRFRHRRAEPRGRGRGRGRGREGHSGDGWSHQPTFQKDKSVEPYSPHDPRPLTPGSFARAAPGQNTFTAPHTSQPPFVQGSEMGAWPGFSQTQAFNPATQGYQQQPMVQPHINPRFASALGWNFYPSAYMQFPQQSQTGQFGQTARTNDWTMPTDSSLTPNQNSDPNNNNVS